ncbi:MAG: protein kinase [Acidobacteria bacterium]|nr:protein kinase [Acidobacteriota bacterium]
MIGSTVSHYRILERLGGGGMGVVYRAEDTRLERTVALKFLPIEWCQEPLLRERFTREAKAASALDHPHICTVFDIGETPQGQLFIAMAHYSGDTLKQRILRGPMSIDEVVEIAIQIGEALGAAHEGGIVHRDVKPANILITDHDQVKVVDFGLAKLAGEATVTRQGSVIGTPAYMSPEQATGDEIDGRSDLWALGAVLYEMVTGRRAFASGSEQAMLLAITTTDPTPIETLRADVPAELQRIIRRCLKRKPKDRYQQASELVADLKRFRGDQTPAEVVTQTLPSAASARRQWSLTRRVFPVAAVVLAVVLAAIAYRVFYPATTRHLVVLPFNCPGADADSEAFCSGLLDTVTAKMAELRRFQSSLSVVPTSEVRGQGVSSADAAHRVFGVDLVVTGSILREGNSIRIPIELVDAERLRQIRSRTITTEETSGFIVQDRIVAVIEGMLDIELGADEKAALMVGGTNNAEAAELFLEARGHAGKTPTEVHLSRAMDLYRQAIELDPKYADAIVQLADACDQRYQLNGDSIWLEHGSSYAQRAVALAPDLPAAQLAAGRFQLANSAHQAAISHLQRAIELDPLGLDAYLHLAEAYEAIGETEVEEDTLARAVRTAPDDWLTYYSIGRFFVYERNEYERAAGYFRKVIELLPESSVGYSALGSSLFYMGDRDGAREQLERAVDIGSDYEAFSNLATLEFYDGNFSEAASLYEQALAMNDRDFLVWNYLAEARSAAGEGPESYRPAYSRAAEIAGAALEADPDNVTLLVHLASFSVHLGNQAGALEYLDRAQKAGVDNAELMFTVADTYERLGERERALEWTENALKAGYPIDVIEDYHDFDDLRADPRFAELAATHRSEK